MGHSMSIFTYKSVMVGVQQYLIEMVMQQRQSAFVALPAFG